MTYRTISQRVERTDPISFHTIEDPTSHPYVVEGDEDHSLLIYFDSDANRRAYLEIPVEHPISELPVNLDNPTDDMIDEG
jgi:hypothetical protein